MAGVFDTDTWRAFVAAIRAAPADDVIRLAAADHLDECGEAERAELIRLEAELVRSGDCEHRPTWPRTLGTRKYRGACASCRLGARRRELIFDRGHDLAAGVGSLGSGPWGFLGAGEAASWEWDRGFVAAVTCRGDKWLAHGDAVLAREPVRAVRLTTWPDVSSHGPTYWLSDDPLGRLFPAGELRPGIDGVEAAMLSHRWPGVAFELPEPFRAAADAGGVTFRSGDDGRGG